MSDAPAKPSRSERLAALDAQITARIQAKKNVPSSEGQSTNQTPRYKIDLAFRAAYKMPPITRYARTPLLHPVPRSAMSEIEVKKNVLQEDDLLDEELERKLGEMLKELYHEQDL